MAIMYPESFPSDRAKDPKREGEALFFDACKRYLSDDYRIFYSKEWRSNAEQTQGEIDFVIIHREMGLVLVEVKGGGIHFDAKTGEWTSTDSHGNEHKIKNPIDQLRRSKGAIGKQIKRQLSLTGRPRILGMIAFPNCESNPGLIFHVEQLSELGKDETLFWEDIDGNQDRFLGKVSKVFEKDSLKTVPSNVVRLTPTHLRKIERRWEEADARSVLASYLTKDEWAIGRLTEQQVGHLKNLRCLNRLAIKGGAGTGKTVLALEKAIRLSQQGYRTLLTCRTPLLARRWELDFQAIKEPCPIVFDFRSLCAEFGIKAGVIEHPPANLLTKEWHDHAPEVLMEALNHPDSVRFDAIIVDEAQDFEETWWEPLQLALEDGDDGILWVFYDDNQRVTKLAGTFPDLPSYCLTENLRNTREIFNNFKPLYPGSDYETKGPQGQPIRFQVVGSDSEEALGSGLREVLKKLIKEGNVAASDIVILTGKTLSRSQANPSSLVPFLEKGKVYAKSYKVTKDYPPSPGYIFVQHILSFKGMEAKVVILVELEDQLEKGTSLYIGMSRAKTHLVIVGTNRVVGYIQAGNLELIGKEGATD